MGFHLERNEAECFRPISFVGTLTPYIINVPICALGLLTCICDPLENNTVISFYFIYRQSLRTLFSVSLVSLRMGTILLIYWELPPLHSDTLSMLDNRRSECYRKNQYSLLFIIDYLTILFFSFL